MIKMSVSSNLLVVKDNFMLFCNISLKVNSEMQPYYNICILEYIVWSKHQIYIKLRQEILSNSDIVTTNDTPIYLLAVVMVSDHDWLEVRYHD